MPHLMTILARASHRLFLTVLLLSEHSAVDLPIEPTLVQAMILVFIFSNQYKGKFKFLNKNEQKWSKRAHEIRTKQKQKEFTIFSWQ